MKARRVGLWPTRAPSRSAHVCQLQAVPGAACDSWLAYDKSARREGLHRSTTLPGCGTPGFGDARARRAGERVSVSNLHAAYVSGAATPAAVAEAALAAVDETEARRPPLRMLIACDRADVRRQAAESASRCGPCCTLSNVSGRRWGPPDLKCGQHVTRSTACPQGLGVFARLSLPCQHKCA